MKVSYQWLQEYFNETLPAPEELGALLNTRAFEVEGIDEVEGDHIIDIDVLPNRAHDCLSHDGIAKEIAVLTGMEISEEKMINAARAYGADGAYEDGGKDVFVGGDVDANRKVIIQDQQCKRYIGFEIDNVIVGKSPEMIAHALQRLGQRSINSIVDITNYVMLETGQPMHAFDAEKVKGDITVRAAAEGEQMTTLDGTELELEEGMMVIADEDGVLALAGVKGGTKAEVDESTTRIILEAANFDGSAVRKAARASGIATDSSKRFENGVAPALAHRAQARALSLIKKFTSNDATVYHQAIDVYPRPALHPYWVGVSSQEIQNKLGITMTQQEIEHTLNQLAFQYKKVSVTSDVLENIQQFIGRSHNTFPSITFDAPHEFDCSSLTSYVYVMSGVPVPRLTVDQYAWGRPITKDEIEPGDLVFANSQAGKIHTETISFMPGTSVPEGIDHVGMYLGDGNIVHTSRHIGSVTVESLAESKHFQNPVGYRRMVESNEERYVITVPDERLDIRQPIDLIEEIGRVYGYDKITPQSVEDAISSDDFAPQINPVYEVNTLIRNILTQEGFSEVMTYSFVQKGDIKPQKPIADDKKYLRTTIAPQLQTALDKNVQNAELLGLNQIAIFEIGTVYTKDATTKAIDEQMHLALGVMNKKGYKKPKAYDTLRAAIETLAEVTEIDLNAYLEKVNEQTSTIEIPMSLFYTNEALHVKLSEQNLATQQKDFHPTKNERFTPISPYPFMLRDISVWVPSDITTEAVQQIIAEHAGELLVRDGLFDVFEKEGRTSYAFRLVFQSHEKTLTDEAINIIMENITAKMTSEGWEVR